MVELSPKIHASEEKATTTTAFGSLRIVVIDITDNFYWPDDEKVNCLSFF